jgi:hypothetical protein
MMSFLTGLLLASTSCVDAVAVRGPLKADEFLEEVTIVHPKLIGAGQLCRAGEKTDPNSYVFRASLRFQAMGRVLVSPVLTQVHPWEKRWKGRDSITAIYAYGQYCRWEVGWKEAEGWWAEVHCWQRGAKSWGILATEKPG